MKKLALVLAGAMMVLSLAACSPTQVDTSNKPQAAQSNPEGVSAEKIAAEKETQIDPKMLVDPNAVAYESVFVYYPNESGTGLDRDMVDFEEVDAEVVVAAMVEAGALEETVTVNSWEVSGGVKPGPGTDPAAVVDGERIGTLDVANLEADADKLTVYALGNTFCEAFELDKLEILVDGEAYTNSAITDGYLYFIDKFEKLN